MFDCIPATAPLLDLVPLLPMAGWDVPAVAALDDVAELIMPEGALPEEAGRGVYKYDKMPT